MQMSTVVADVYYTASDETYYVGAGPGRYQDLYGNGSVADAVARAESDGWQACGLVGRHEGEAVPMWGRGSSSVTFYYAELIAIWSDPS
jgi:hypothetical protein